MFDWHAILFPVAESVQPEKLDVVEWKGRTLQPIQLPADFDCVFETSFDQLLECMSTRALLFVELDGSYVWREPVDESGESFLQWDGVIYEFGNQVGSIEIKGAFCQSSPESQCWQASFQRLLDWLNHSSQAFAAEWVPAGVTISGTEFVELVSNGHSSSSIDGS